MKSGLHQAIQAVLADPSNLPQPFLDYLIQYAAVNPVPVGAVSAPLLISTGLTGATKSVRIAGSTTSGAPTQGAWQLGDMVPSQDGHVYICTTAGSPGLWTDASLAPVQSASSLTLAGDLHLTTAGNTVEQGGVLTLESVVSNPTIAPSLSAATGGTLFDPGSNGYAFACYTWVDGSGHESLPSPVSTGYSLPRGVLNEIALNIAIPAIPGGATAFHVYALTQIGSTPPSASTLKRQAATTYITSETARPTKWTTYNSSGANPPGASTFPTGTSAKIVDSSGTTLVGGDDSSGIFASKTSASTQTFAAIVAAPSSQIVLSTSTGTGTATVTPDLAVAQYWAISRNVDAGGGLTIGAPANPPDSSHSAQLVITVTNSGTTANLGITWNAAFVATSVTIPSTLTPGGEKRCVFWWNGTHWEIYASI